MADLQTIFSAIDELNPSELDQVAQYIQARRNPHHGWVVTSEQIAQIKEVMRPVHEETSTMNEDEINAAIDQAIDEVRRERKTSRGV